MAGALEVSPTMRSTLYRGVNTHMNLYCNGLLFSDEKTLLQRLHIEISRVLVLNMSSFQKT